jgi:hypothetical protein
VGKKLKFYETDSFKELQKDWYQKIATAEDAYGEKFEDIENGEDISLMRPQIFATNNLEYNTSPDYRALCESILREYKFRRDAHKVAFALHADGKSNREIQVILKTKHAFLITHQAVSALIKRVKLNYVNGKGLNGTSKAVSIKG